MTRHTIAGFIKLAETASSFALLVQDVGPIERQAFLAIKDNLRNIRILLDDISNEHLDIVLATFNPKSRS